MNKKSKKIKKSNNKKLIIIGVVIIFLVLILSCIICLCLKNKNEIPDDYIAIFHGGSGEITYRTYIYKIDNDQNNYGFKYINETCMTTSWGSKEVKCEVDSKGKFDWTDGAFSVAREHNAYSYVETKDGKTYTIEEYQGMFLMN